MVVESVERLPDDHPPPTEKQLEFAKKLKLTIPEDADKRDASELISIRLKEDKEPTERHLGFAKKYGVKHSKYIGKKTLFFRILDDLKEKAREDDLTAWFTYRVYRDLVHGKENADIEGPDDPTIKKIAARFAKEASIVRSIRKYEGDDLIWFGQLTDYHGEPHYGGSNTTTAYKKASSLLCDELGLYPRRRPKPKRIAHDDDYDDDIEDFEEEPGEASKGCISTIRWVILILALLAVVAILF